MPQLTDRDKKILRLAISGIAVYLVLFFGWRGWKTMEGRRAEHQKLVARARAAENELQPYENKVLLFEKLRDATRLDPRKLSNDSLAADASAAIQKAAREGGFKLGPIRENAGRSTGRELSSIQIEGMGPVTNALALVHRIQTLGYPLLIDALQLTPQPQPPGMVKMSVTIVILNFDQWKKGVGPNA
jgi:hypothetical protein